MTLLSVASQVCDEIGLEPITTLVANIATNQQCRQLLALAKRTVTDLQLKDWPQLDREGSITTNPLTPDAYYAFPADYDRLAVDTAYIAADYLKVRATVPDAEWFARRYGALGDLPGEAKYALQRGPSGFRIDPNPDAAATVIFLYFSNKPVLAADGVTYKTEFTVDTDTCVIPERLLALGLKWRMMRAKGMDYAEEYNEFERAVMKTYADALALPTITRNTRLTGSQPDIGYVPESGYGA